MHIALVILLPLKKVASNDNSFIYNLLEGIQIPVHFICEWCCFPYWFAKNVCLNRCISNGRAGSDAQRDRLVIALTDVPSRLRHRHRLHATPKSVLKKEPHIRHRTPSKEKVHVKVSCA